MKRIIKLLFYLFLFSSCVGGKSTMKDFVQKEIQNNTVLMDLTYEEQTHQYLVYTRFLPFLSFTHWESCKYCNEHSPLSHKSDPVVILKKEDFKTKLYEKIFRITYNGRKTTDFLPKSLNSV